MVPLQLYYYHLIILIIIIQRVPNATDRAGAGRERPGMSGTRNADIIITISLLV